MQRRTALALGLALVLATGLGWWGWQTNNRVRAVEFALEASYQRAFFDLIENMETIDSLLGKSLASGAEGQRIMTLTSAWHEAETARTNLGNMPLGMVNMMRSQQYLAQLGDFCYVLAEKQARGREITAEEWEQLSQLHEQTRDVHAGLRDLMTEVQNQDFRWRSLAQRSRTQQLTPEARSISDGFGQLDQRLRDQVPTITYDGPFSDHVEDQEPQGLSGENITEAQARDIALDFLQLRDGSNYQIERVGKARGRIPAFNIQVRQDGEDSPQIAVDVSQQGGHIVWMLNSRVPQEGSIALTEAVTRAEEFLDQRGMEDMVTTGSIREGNQLTVTFAHQQDEVIIYPDLVKVTVALDDGEIVGYDAMGFLMSHHDRDLPEPVLTPEEAQERVPEHLDVQRTRLAVIPMSNLEERLCYEVRGKVNGDTYLVYVNAETGEEETILQLIETDAGTRAM